MSKILQIRDTGNGGNRCIFLLLIGDHDKFIFERATNVAVGRKAISTFLNTEMFLAMTAFCSGHLETRRRPRLCKLSPGNIFDPWTIFTTLCVRVFTLIYVLRFCLTWVHLSLFVSRGWPFCLNAPKVFTIRQACKSKKRLDLERQDCQGTELTLQATSSFAFFGIILNNAVAFSFSSLLIIETWKWYLCAFWNRNCSNVNVEVQCQQEYVKKDNNYTVYKKYTRRWRSNS